MAWLESPLHVAAEVAPAAWVLVGAEGRGAGAPRLTAARAFDAHAQTLVDELRQFRVSARLPLDTRVIFWPRAGDAGVGDLDTRSEANGALPKVKVIRERVAPLVRSGARVTGVVLPESAAAALVERLRQPAACVLAVHEGAACIALVTNSPTRTGAPPAEIRARYLSWSAEAGDDAGQLLRRYQFGARLAPHVRDVLGAARHLPLLACGTMPTLRAAMTPLVEELDHEIDVLDFSLAGETLAADGEPDEIAGRQLAWALAARGSA